MPFVQAKCPECGGMLAVDDSKKAAMCQFCGEAFIVQEAINNYNTYNTYNNNYDNRTTHNYSEGAVVNVYETQNSVSSIMERGFIFLEDGDFARADEYFEKVLNIEPENVQAYHGKLMAEVSVKRKEALKDCPEPFDSNNSYQKIMRYGDDVLKKELSGHVEGIKKRNEDVRVEGIYSCAVDKMQSAKTADVYMELAHEFKSIASYKNAAVLAKECLEKAEEKIKFLKERRELYSKFSTRLCGFSDNIVGIKSNGTIISTHKISTMYNIKKWENMVSIYLMDDHMVGLKSNGTVVAARPKKMRSILSGEFFTPDYGQCDVSDWTDVIEISCSRHHTVGLKSDGTVVSTKIKDIKYENRGGVHHSGTNDTGQCNVSDWKDIIAISAGEFHTVGLKSDGTVVAVGENGLYCRCNVSHWTDIVAISASQSHTVGLKADGTVVAVGDYRDGECNVSNWTDIIGISATYSHTFGLKSDGTVVAVGQNSYGECNVSDWTDIVAFSASNPALKIKSDGSVVSSYMSAPYNIRKWKLF